MHQICKSNLRIVVILTSALVAGCEAEKSYNPLSPSIAGPIAGVSISAPAPTGLVDGVLVNVNSQPLTLTFGSAASNSVRPFWYELDIATDRDFAQVVHRVERIEPSDGGRISYQVPATLDPERVYYWRVRALDGANTGPYSSIGSFEIYTPVVVKAPNPISPSGGRPIDSRRVTLTAGNAEVSGPAKSPVIYRFELATDPEFTNVIAAMTLNQNGDRTTSTTHGDLDWNQPYYWRVQARTDAREGEIVSSWSSVETFLSPPEPVILGVPIPLSPIHGVLVGNNTPTLVATNGLVQGPAGQVTYRFEVATDTGFVAIVAAMEVPRSGGDTTSVTTTALPKGKELYWRVNARAGSVTTEWSAVPMFRTPADAPPPPPPPPPGGGGGGGGGGGEGGRAPDPAPGQRLPLPNMFHIVQEVASQYPGALRNSCQDHGGTWEFMDRVVSRLRQFDTRWGYNCKRGNCGDVSRDVVDYHYGPGPDQGSTDVYIIDIISGHCGPSPSPAWVDQTEVTRQGGTIGRWKFPR